MSQSAPHLTPLAPHPRLERRGGAPPALGALPAARNGPLCGVTWPGRPLRQPAATAATTLLRWLPVSLYTDKVQGVGVFVFTIMVSVAAFGFYELPTTSSNPFVQGNWAVVTTWGIGGSVSNSFKMAFILLSAVISADMMHLGFQQRIWAAETDKAVMRGAVGGIVLTIIFMCFFAVVGMIAFANLGVLGLAAVGPDVDYLAFLAAFFIIDSMPVGWQAFSIVLAVMLVASSAATVQTDRSGGAAQASHTPSA